MNDDVCAEYPLEVSVCRQIMVRGRRFRIVEDAADLAVTF
ncbi:MAG: hypothetical protein A4E42_01587 [Methanoregulaceae archaeon PtaU1.Bin222]|nr:MAG: hypothetical protein A4E42_01587 [Methanoregulaceae archaeon PtaU1.Bin222]